MCIAGTQQNLAFDRGRMGFVPDYAATGKSSSLRHTVLKRVVQEGA